MKQRLENQGNRPAWEEMTTQELDGLLWRDLAADQEGFLDPADILAMTEVINSREEDTPTDADVQAAWETFRARIREEEPTPTESIPEEAPAAVPFAKPERKKPGRKKLRWAVAAAAVVCLLAVPALGGDGMESLVNWTAETFSFGKGNGIDESRSAIMFSELESQVSALTDLPVLPAWYPDGTRIEQVETYEVSGSKDICAVFERQGEEFSLSITVYETIPEQMGGYEKNDEIPKQYFANGIPHYIMGNMDWHSAAWVNENVECFIQGNLTVEELTQMIDSIYE